MQMFSLVANRPPGGAAHVGRLRPVQVSTVGRPVPTTYIQPDSGFGFQDARLTYRCISAIYRFMQEIY